MNQLIEMKKKRNQSEIHTHTRITNESERERERNNDLKHVYHNYLNMFALSSNYCVQNDFLKCRSFSLIHIKQSEERHKNKNAYQQPHFAKHEFKTTKPKRGKFLGLSWNEQKKHLHFLVFKWFMHFLYTLNDAVRYSVTWWQTWHHVEPYRFLFTECMNFW